MAANSKFIANRIRNTWEREAQVIYPPVDVEAIQSVDDWSQNLTQEEFEILHQLPSDFILGASRLVPYKKMDDVINVGDAIKLPVVIVGEGPERSRLQALADKAKVPVYFLGRVSNPLLYTLYERTQLFVFPPVEDFGIVPVEAMAAGAPVLANRVGGASESVLESVTGSLTSFEDMSETVKNAGKAMACQAFESRRRAQMFSEREFVTEINKWVSFHTTGADLIAR
ncbi:glycosyltransferase [Arthrobacter sp. ZGTC212]|uniref:glycosyltransferase n=1 Tax=Arthrobacter sp. ZGTC212 TaxID=2058899 RepID=UPI0015E1D944|nr:glycosyltransferase [Arthrobacter sp. ZGTC212]